ncbi:LRMP protein, partial [Asarcornis scutulata]|nr:LRMP protein [Asarcornis scutulata]
SSPSYFTPREDDAQNQWCALASTESKDAHHEKKYLTSSPHLQFFTSDKKSESAVIRSPAPQRLSLNEGGKVAVSKIVDYLRHTTSRGSEDSGLEELCNMLDPEQKDISMDLETYHAIMKEWIEDCKRKWEDGTTEEPTASIEDLEFKVHKNTFEGADHFIRIFIQETLLSYSITKTKFLSVKRTPVRMNVTSGSLEAFGGDVSKGDMETSDLIICVADLQYNNQKLQEENNKLRLTLEAVDETNNKLLADNENLHQQIKSIQHSVLKAKSLEEELEEAKNNLNLLEEKRQQIFCQNKQLEKENQSLIIKMASLQEENIRSNMDADGLQKKILELSKNAAELQIQAHIYESTVVNKEASLIQKEQDIKELKLTIVECSSIIETLRAEKNNLLENMRYMQQELISNGLSFPVMYKFNGSVPEGMNSLHCELELAQSSEITKAEWMSLDETLDREVLFLLQGPEYAGEKFKLVMQNLVSGIAYVN